MRHLGYALVVVVCSFAVAMAKPKKGPKPPKQDPKAQTTKQVDKATEEQLRKLDQEYYAQSAKQAYYAAAKIAKKIYDLQVKATGADSIEAERRKQTLAGVLSSAGDYVGAEKLYGEILKATEKRHGPESRETLYALLSYMSIYYAQTRYDELEPIYARMKAITKKLDGEKSKEYAQQLTQEGTLNQIRNVYTSAQRNYEEALQIYEALAPSKDDQSLVSPLQLLAGLLWQTNQQTKAIALYDRAIKIAESSKDMMFVLKISTIWSTASQYSFGGRKDLAGPLFKKSIAMTEAELTRLEKDTPDDWQIGSLLTQLAFMYRQNNDFVKAEETYIRAIKNAEKKKQMSGMESSLADIKRIQGKNKEAYELLQKAKTELAKYAPGSATAYNTMIADVLRDMGEYDKALKVLDEYRTDVVKKWGKKHTTYGYLQMSAHNILARAGKVQQAEGALDEYLDIAERELSGVLRAGTDTDHAVYFSRNSYVLDTALNFNMIYAPKSGSAARLALTTLLRRKGRILDAAAAALATIRSKLSPDDKKLLDELASARAQLAKLSVAGSADPDLGNEIAALEEKIQRLEMQVAKKSAAYRTVTQPIELAAIQKLIPKDGRLVELVNYQPYDPKATYAQLLSLQMKPRRYAAYVVGTSGDPVLVELGEAAPIEAAIEKFRKALADPDNDSAVDLGKALYDLTMAKVIPKLGGATNLLLAPDGALNVVPFAALVDDKKQFLIKKFTFTYLTSGRDLLRLSAKTKAQGGGVMFADPQFDAVAPANDNKTRGRRSADLASFKWPQLPGTAAEADAVAKTFKNLKVFRGEAATEGTLKKVKGPQVLHLATHGFFLPDEKPPEVPEGQGGQGLGGGAAAMPPVPGAGGGPKPEQFENPLLRSGLALAGANKLASGDDDGLLTALEASNLDLWGTKLVVLSACETGVGKVTNGDGVYGLRRSLVIAGAESLVMSMWQVDDFATKELMAGFYKKLTEGKPRSSALRDVQLELLAKPKYAHPFYWAAFVPAGATTPLKD
jgi:CHAT domain-containing protein